jgi:hypothetical protein
MTFRSTALFILYAVFISEAGADEFNVSTLDDNLVRDKYINSPQLPDGPAFTHLVGLLSSMDEETASQILQSALEIDADESTHILDRISEEYGRLHAAIAAANVDEGCISGVPRVYGDDVYPVLDAMDDDAERVGTTRLARFLKETDPKIATKLMQWIRTQKTNISYVKFDHEKLHSPTGYSGDVTLSTICNSLSGSEEEN